MRSRFSLLLLSILTSFIFSCKTSKPVVQTSEPVQTVTDYIDRYKDLAVSEMKRTGIPASITLAQGIIESDCGRSSLARGANNHFGIKCHDDWTGSTMKFDDNRRNECFRKYPRAEESFYDHSDFLKSGSRYDFLFELNSQDYKSWAYGLKKAGYATNPDYANMLIRTIETYSLWNYDSGITGRQQILAKRDSDQMKSLPSAASSNKRVSGNVAVYARAPRILEKNRIQYIIVKDGDTREKLENEFSLLKWELPRYNEVKTDFVPVPGQILYLQPKREKAEPGAEYYTTKEGDSIYEVSQLFGIKLRSLCDMNRLADTLQLVPGTKLWLRKPKPVL